MKFFENPLSNLKICTVISLRTALFNISANANILWMHFHQRPVLFRFQPVYNVNINNTSFIRGAAWLFFLVKDPNNERPILNDINVETQPTQCNLAFVASPLDSGGLEGRVGTCELLVSGCCSSTGKWLHLQPPTAPWSLIRALLPARSWRWRRQTEPGSSLCVREVEKYSGEHERMFKWFSHWERKVQQYTVAATRCHL